MGLRQKVSAVYANMTFNDLDSQPLIWWISPAIEFFGELKNTIYAYALEAVRSQNSSSRSLDTAKKNPGWNSVCSRAHFTGDTFKKELKTNRPLRPWAEAAECEIVYGSLIIEKSPVNKKRFGFYGACHRGDTVGGHQKKDIWCYLSLHNVTHAKGSMNMLWWLSVTEVTRVLLTC